MKKLTSIAAISLLALVTSCTTSTVMTKESQSALTPKEALEKLQAGNERFATGRSLSRNLPSQVKATSGGQYPFASVVSCLDSRTSTELIFDQGIGDVFNARVAGNIVNEDIIGSLEFASKAAGSKVILVVGHTKCGAVMGACDKVELGNLTGLLNKIQPSVAATRTSAGEARNSKNMAFVDRVAETNVRKMVKAIRERSAILRDMEKKGEIMIAGAMYDLETGRVSLLN